MKFFTSALSIFAASVFLSTAVLPTVKAQLVPLALRSPRAVDSLAACLRQKISDGQRIQLLLARSMALRSKSTVSAILDSANHHAQAALAIAKRKNLKSGITQAYKELAAIADARNQYTEALAHITEAEKTSPDSNSTALLLLLKGQIYEHTSAYKEALLYQEQALSIGQRRNDLLMQASAHMILAETLRRQGNTNKALENDSIALRLFERLRRPDGVALCLNTIGFLYRVKGDYSRALDYLNRALPIFKSIGDKFNVASALNTIGVVYMQKADYASALQYYKQAGQYAEEVGSFKAASAIFHNIGRTYTDKGNLEDGLTYYMKARQYSEQIGDKHALATILSSIGTVYWLQPNDSLSRHYHEQALRLRERIGDKIGIGSSLHGLALIDERSGRIAEAITNTLRASTLFQEANDAVRSMRMIQMLGSLYRVTNRLDSALLFYKKAQALIEKNGDRASLPYTFHGIAETYQQMGNDSLALHYAERAVILGDSLKNMAFLRSGYQLLSSLQVATGNEKKALESYKLAMAYKDSVASEEKTKQLARLELRYTLSKKEAENVALRKDSALQFALLRERTYALERKNLLADAQQYEIVSLHNERTLRSAQDERRAAELEIQRLAAKERAQEVTILQQQNSLQGELLNHERRARLVLTAGLIGAVAVSFLFAMLWRAKERARQMVEEQQHALSSQAIEIQHINGLLTQQNQRLQEIDQEKNDFLGIVAHDLKNPLAGAQMLASSLAERLSEKDSHAAKQASKIESVTLSMIQTVRTLLDVNKIESGSLGIQIDHFDAIKSVQALVDDALDHAAAKNISIELDAPNTSLMIWSNELAFLHIVENLLSNAIKFTPPDGSVVVQIKKTYHENLSATLHLRLSNQGAAIAAAEHDKLFRKFEQLSTTPTAGEHSTGLGLSIVKRFVDALEGSIRYHHEHGMTTFYVELPDKIFLSRDTQKMYHSITTE